MHPIHEDGPQLGFSRSYGLQEMGEENGVLCAPGQALVKAVWQLLWKVAANGLIIGFLPSL